MTRLIRTGATAFAVSLVAGAGGALIASQILTDRLDLLAISLACSCAASGVAWPCIHGEGSLLRPAGRSDASAD